MQMFVHRSHHTSTKFIQVDTRVCEACWKCIEVCHKQALGKVDIFGHRHVKIVDADSCAGCLKCVKACDHAAITALDRRKDDSMDTKTGKREFNRRGFISLSMFIAGLILPVSGLLNHQLGFMGMTQERHFWMAVHNSAAAMFVILGVLHVVQNWKALVHHAKAIRDRVISKEAVAAVGVVCLTVALIASHALHAR
jgi:ferredoxin